MKGWKGTFFPLFPPFFLRLKFSAILDDADEGSQTSFPPSFTDRPFLVLDIEKKSIKAPSFFLLLPLISFSFLCAEEKGDRRLLSSTLLPPYSLSLR